MHNQKVWSVNLIYFKSWIDFHSTDFCGYIFRSIFDVTVSTYVFDILELNEKCKKLKDILKTVVVFLLWTLGPFSVFFLTNCRKHNFVLPHILESNPIHPSDKIWKIQSISKNKKELDNWNKTHGSYRSRWPWVFFKKAV